MEGEIVFSQIDFGLLQQLLDDDELYNRFVKEGYDNYYQTIAYVESLSDVELAELTNEIDSITIDDAKSKVYINTPKA